MRGGKGAGGGVTVEPESGRLGRGERGIGEKEAVSGDESVSQ